MKVSIILCTYNRASTLDATLQSLFRVQTPAGLEWEIVAVNNNSTDDTDDVLMRWRDASPVPMVVLRELRQGKSFALNSGIASAQGEILVFTDDDVEFGDAWLKELVGPFTEPDVLGVGGRIEAVWVGPVPKWWRRTGPFQLPAAVGSFHLGLEPMNIRTTPHGANMAFRRSVFQRFGGFREDLGPTVESLLRGEDTEMGQRVINSGGRIAYAPGAVVYHPVDPRRAQKSYFRRWAFDLGRSSIRINSMQNSAKRFFGVPRFMFRDLLSSAGRAVMATRSTDAFFWELQFRIWLGRIYECWRLRDERRTIAEDKIADERRAGPRIAWK